MIHVSKTFAVVAAATLMTTVSCSKTDGTKGSTGSLVSIGADALVAQIEPGKIGFHVGSDGSAKVAVESGDGKPLTKTVTGTLVFAAEGAEGKTVPLTFDDKSGVLVAQGPKLDADLNQVAFTVNVDGKPTAGTLYLPRGGTDELAAMAKSDVVTPDAKKGPHGGVVQALGADHLEVVSNDSGQVRVYVLDAELKPLAVEDRVVKLGVGGEKPEVVVLTPDPSGQYLVGTWHVTGDPVTLTIAEKKDSALKVVLVGYKHGAPVALGRNAPRWKIATAEKWADPVRLQGNGNPIGTGMGKGLGNATVVNVDKDKDHHGDPKVERHAGKGHGK